MESLIDLQNAKLNIINLLHRFIISNNLCEIPILIPLLSPTMGRGAKLKLPIDSTTMLVTYQGLNKVEGASQDEFT